jgi:hypothetical protein
MGEGFRVDLAALTINVNEKGEITTAWSRNSNGWRNP